MRGEDGVAQGWVRSLHSEVAEDGGVGLDAVSLLVVVGEVEQLQTEVGPLPLHRLAVQSADIHHLLLQGQQSTAVRPLQNKIRQVSDQVGIECLKLYIFPMTYALWNCIYYTWNYQYMYLIVLQFFF